MTALTSVHVVLSLAGIGSGFIVVFGLIAAKRLDGLTGLTALFLASTVATSLTGFLFPFHKLLPSHVVCIVSVVVLAIAIQARYARHFSGAWRWIYALNVVIGLYLNVFVLVAQAFQKMPALKTMAPTESEAPFVITQIVVLALFVVLGILAVNAEYRIWISILFCDRAPHKVPSETWVGGLTGNCGSLQLCTTLTWPAGVSWKRTVGKFDAPCVVP